MDAREWALGMLEVVIGVVIAEVIMALYITPRITAAQAGRGPVPGAPSASGSFW